MIVRGWCDVHVKERTENIAYWAVSSKGAIVAEYIRASSLQEDAEDDAAMILDATSQAAISRERLMPADPYRGRSSNASTFPVYYPGSEMWNTRRIGERIVFNAV